MPKKFTFDVELVFAGSVIVAAASEEEALRLVQERFYGSLHSCGDKTEDRFVNWEFPAVGETRINS